MSRRLFVEKKKHVDLRVQSLKSSHFHGRISGVNLQFLANLYQIHRLKAGRMSWIDSVGASIKKKKQYPLVVFRVAGKIPKL